MPSPRKEVENQLSELNRRVLRPRIRAPESLCKGKSKSKGKAKVPKAPEPLVRGKGKGTDRVMCETGKQLLESLIKGEYKGMVEMAKYLPDGFYKTRDSIAKGRGNFKWIYNKQVLRGEMTKHAKLAITEFNKKHQEFEFEFVKIVNVTTWFTGVYAIYITFDARLVGTDYVITFLAEVFTKFGPEGYKLSLVQPKPEVRP